MHGQGIFRHATIVAALSLLCNTIAAAGSSLDFLMARGRVHKDCPKKRRPLEWMGNAGSM